MNTKYYDKYLTEAKNGINALLFPNDTASTAEDIALLTDVQAGYAAIQSASSATEATKKANDLTQMVLRKYTERLRDNDEAEDRQKLANIQQNLMYFMQKKYPHEIDLGQYIRLPQPSTPEEIETNMQALQNQQAIIPLSEGLQGSFDAIDRYGKIDPANQATLINPDKITSTPKTDKDGNPVLVNGKPAFKLTSKDPQTMIQNMMALKRTSLNFSGFVTPMTGLLSPFYSSESSNLVERTLQEASANLYSIDVKATINTKEGPQSFSITNGDQRVIGMLSKEARRSAYINQALYANKDIEDPCEKTVATFKELIDANHKVSAKRFLDQQLKLHGNDPAYMESLRQAAENHLRNTPDQAAYQAFYKDMYRKIPDPLERSKDPIERAREESFQYNKNEILDANNGQLSQEIQNIKLMLESLGDDHPQAAGLHKRLEELSDQVEDLRKNHHSNTYRSFYQEADEDKSVHQIQMLSDTQNLPTTLEPGVLYIKKGEINENMYIYSTALGEEESRSLTSTECDALKALGNSELTAFMNDHSTNSMTIKNDQDHELLKNIVSTCTQPQEVLDTEGFHRIVLLNKAASLPEEMDMTPGVLYLKNDGEGTIKSSGKNNLMETKNWNNIDTNILSNTLESQNNTLENQNDTLENQNDTLESQNNTFNTFNTFLNNTMEEGSFEINQESNHVLFQKIAPTFFHDTINIQSDMKAAVKDAADPSLYIQEVSNKVSQLNTEMKDLESKVRNALTPAQPSPEEEVTVTIEEGQQPNHPSQL